MGEDAEYERFFSDQYSSIVYAVLSIVGDLAEAECISQDAFVKALTRWRRVRGYDKPGAWVRRVAIRDAVRSARRTRRNAPLADADVPVSPRYLDGDEELDAALASLSARQRACVVLRHVEGWTADEIGEALGCAPATVRVHLYRGRAALAQYLESVDKEEAADGH